MKATDREGFITLTNRMINDKQFYSEGVEISRQLITQFEKASIRKRLIEIFQNVLDNYQLNISQMTPQLAD